VTTRRYSLDTPPFTGRTGRGVTVAVVDSGIASGHPHVGAIQRGIALVGEDPSDFRDRIGHGTAVAAAIREKAPDAELLAVRVFDRALSTSADTLARAIVWSAEHGAALINLSLGTNNPAREALMREAVIRVQSLGALVVAASAGTSPRWLPGSLDGVVGVELDWECPRDQIHMVERSDHRVTLRASGFPRPIPGVAPERNLSGLSFAVANATGFLARALEGRDASPLLATIAACLAAEGEPRNA
jgi:subtilisin family serine protease